MADDKYQQNDLGYFTNNSYLEHGGGAWYRWTKPKSFYNRLNLNFRANLSHLWKSFNPDHGKYQYWNVSSNINGQLKNLWRFGITADYRPEQQDFYEPRLAGQMFRMPGSWMSGFWLSTNAAKRYSARVEF